MLAPKVISSDVIVISSWKETGNKKIDPNKLRFQMQLSRCILLLKLCQNYPRKLPPKNNSEKTLVKSRCPLGARKVPTEVPIDAR